MRLHAHARRWRRLLGLMLLMMLLSVSTGCVSQKRLYMQLQAMVKSICINDMQCCNWLVPSAVSTPVPARRHATTVPPCLVIRKQPHAPAGNATEGCRGSHAGSHGSLHGSLSDAFCRRALLHADAAAGAGHMRWCHGLAPAGEAAESGRPANGHRPKCRGAGGGRCVWRFSCPLSPVRGYRPTSGSITCHSMQMAFTIALNWM